MQEVLREQAKMREKKGYALRIGLMMLNAGVITERQLAIGLASQFGTAAVDLVNTEIEVGLLAQIPPQVFEKWPFIPMHQDEDGLRIAMDDEPPQELIDALTAAVHVPINFVVAPSSQLQKVRGFCRQHMRRIMAGQLDRTTLPETYFAEEEGDPESTIRPGAFTVPSLVPAGGAPVADDPLDALSGVNSAGGGARAAAPPPDLVAALAAARSSKPGEARPPSDPGAAKAAPVPSDPGSPRTSTTTNPGVASEDASFANVEEPGDAFGAVAMDGGGDPLDAFAVAPAAEDDPLDALDAMKKPPAPPPPAAKASPAGAKIDPMEALRKSAQAAAPAAPKPNTPPPPPPKPAPAPVPVVEPAGSRDGMVTSEAAWEDSPFLEDLKPAGVPGGAHRVEVDALRMDTVPPLSRLLVTVPATLDSLLRELKTGAVESVTVAPRAQGADVLATDELGTRQTGALGKAEYDAVLERCLALLKAPGRAPEVPVRQVVEHAVDGAPFSFRLTALPSAPPTLTLASADRDGWSARRQVFGETALVEALAKRARARRGLMVVTGPIGSPVSETLSGILAALRRDHLRIATFAASAEPRVRDVTTMAVPPEKAAEILDMETLLAVAETGVELLAFDLSLTNDRLRMIAPVASAEACVLVSMRERDTLDALIALAKAKIPLDLLASSLEIIVSVNRADRICSACRKPITLTDDKLPGPLKGSKLVGATAYESPGCAVCKKTGVRGTVAMYEVLTWDRDKVPLDTLSLDRKGLLKRAHELGMVKALSVEARKALGAGTISLNGYLKLLGLLK